MWLLLICHKRSTKRCANLRKQSEEGLVCEGYGMNSPLLKGLVALVPACMLLSGSAVLFFRAKTPAAFLQLFGAGCLIVVALAHVCEAVYLFPWMHQGLEHSIGHYLDLSSAILGLTLFPAGYLFYALGRRHV